MDLALAAQDSRKELGHSAHSRETFGPHGHTLSAHSRETFGPHDHTLSAHSRETFGPHGHTLSAHSRASGNPGQYSPAVPLALDPRFRGGERKIGTRGITTPLIPAKTLAGTAPHSPLIPAKAGIQGNQLRRLIIRALDPRFRGGERSIFPAPTQIAPLAPAEAGVSGKCEFPHPAHSRGSGNPETPIRTQQ